MKKMFKEAELFLILSSPWLHMKYNIFNNKARCSLHDVLTMNICSKMPFRGFNFVLRNRNVTNKKLMTNLDLMLKLLSCSELFMQIINLK